MKTHQVTGILDDFPYFTGTHDECKAFIGTQDNFEIGLNRQEDKPTDKNCLVTFTNNKKRTKGVIASARNNATKGYAQLMKDYFQNLLSKTREEVIEIRLNLDKRFNNYILACKEAEKLLFNKELLESKEQLNQDNAEVS